MLEYWLLPAIVALGVVTSLEDIKAGKIRNKWIVFALAYAFVVFHYLFFFTEVYYLTIQHFYAILLNGIIAFVVGFLFWRLQFWTAGDAKLFFAFSILMPPVLTAGKASLTVFDMLINTFIPVGLYLCFSALDRSSLKEKQSILHDIFSVQKLSISILLLFFLIWPISIVSNFIQLPGAFIVFVLIIMLLLRNVKNLYTAGGLIVIGLLACLRFLFDPLILFLETWIHFGFIVIAYLVLRFFLTGIASSAFTKKVDFKKLTQGMVPAEVIIHEKKKYHKKAINYTELKKGESFVFALKPEGLSSQDIKKLKSLKQKSIHSLKVRETLSFAPFLFIGALLQIILKDNVVSFVITLFSLWYALV